MQLLKPGTLHLCEDAVEMYLLGRLSPHESIIVISHCSECKSCFTVAYETSEYVRTMQNVSAFLSLEKSGS